MFNNGNGYSLSDIAAISRGNEDGMWGGNSAWWIILLFMFAGWGGNGWGGGGAGNTRDAVSYGFDINGLGYEKDGRGNICPVTIIMPTLAMRAMTEMPKNAIVTKEVAKVYDENGNFIKNTEVTITKWDEVESFMELLDQKIHEAKDMLLERFEWICSQNPASAKFMYENGLMAGYIPEEGIRSALKHGTLAIGQIGLAETLQILVGQDHTEELGMELAKRIEALFKTRCAEFKEEYKLNFGVYYTPRHNWVA